MANRQLRVQKIGPPLSDVEELGTGAGRIPGFQLGFGQDVLQRDVVGILVDQRLELLDTLAGLTAASTGQQQSRAKRVRFRIVRDAA